MFSFIGSHRWPSLAAVAAAAVFFRGIVSLSRRCQVRSCCADRIAGLGAAVQFRILTPDRCRTVSFVVARFSLLVTFIILTCWQGCELSR